MSGQGAAIRGGRFNRPGRAALYLSLDIVTAVRECAQGFAERFPPLTICEYDVDCEPVADLTDLATRDTLEVAFEDLACPWLRLHLDRRPVASWQVVDRLLASGFAGAIVPSFAPGAGAGARNLVLWRWGDALPTAVKVYDPDGRLPRDQSSWQ